MDELWSARIGVGPYLMLTSWRSLLDRMAAKVSAAADSHAEIDIRQLQGLAEQQDAEAFLPLKQEELGPQLPRRVIDLSGLVDDAVRRAGETKWVSTKGARMAATAKSYGIWLTFPRAETALGTTSPFFGVGMIFGLETETPRCGFASITRPRSCAVRWNPCGKETRPDSSKPTTGPTSRSSCPSGRSAGRYSMRWWRGFWRSRDCSRLSHESNN